MKLFDMMTDEDMKRIKKDSGPIDLTLKIDQLELENKCREAGRAMIELNVKYEGMIKEVDRLSEENNNLKTMMKGNNDTSNAG